MSKTLISVLVVAVVLVGGYFALNAKKKDVTPAVNSEEQATEPAGKKVAFSEFVKRGGSYKCEVNQAMSDFENSGTVYINGKNLRGEYSTVAEGRKLYTYFIFREDYMYTWSSMTPETGVRVKVNTDVTGSGSMANLDTFAWNAEQVGDYNCVAWTADESKFAVPANITFQAIGA